MQVSLKVTSWPTSEMEQNAPHAQVQNKTNQMKATLFSITIITFSGFVAMWPETFKNTDLVSFEIHLIQALITYDQGLRDHPIIADLLNNQLLWISFDKKCITPDFVTYCQIALKFEYQYGK
jgi:hypothetical protein